MLSKLVLLPLLLVNIALASDVLEFHDSDFDTKIQEHEVALVEFFAPWCGHCKRLAPEYEKAATALKNNDPPIALVKVDCTVETSTCSKQGVNGYPTLKIFKSGSVFSDYNGPREADGIVKYMRTKAGPAAKELTTVAEAEKFLNNDEQSIVAFFESDSNALLTDFKKVADQLAERYRFAFSTKAEVLKKYNHKNEIVIYQPPRLQSKLESTENVYPGTKNFDILKAYIENEIHGLVGHRTTGNQQDFAALIGPTIVVYYNVDYVKDAKGTNYVRNRVLKVAKKVREDDKAPKIAKFAISNAEEFRTELAEFGFGTLSNDAKYVIARDVKGLKYKMTDEYSPENLEKFVYDVMNGKLEPHMKSEPLPDNSDDNVAKVVVAKNFDEIVNDETKDVLIEFYAPWCGHCKSLAPKYDELAKKLKGEKNIVIAKIDATANDVPPQYDVKGFPTIYFAPAKGKQNPKKYEGGREVDDFIKYIAKEATQELSGYDRSGKKSKKDKKDKTDL